MQTHDNPYAPPKSLQSAQSPTDCYRQGPLLVVPAGSGLPERCIKCNAPAEMGKPRAHSWHHPGWYLFVLFNVIVYAVIAMFVSKKAKFAVGLCAFHRRRRRNITLVALTLLIVGIVLVVMAVGGDNAVPGVLGGICLLISVIVAIVGTRLLHPARISNEDARMKGCGEAFLDSLPTR